MTTVAVTKYELSLGQTTVTFANNVASFSPTASNPFLYVDNTGLYYTISSSAAALVGYNGDFTSTTLTIPNTISYDNTQYTVTSIGVNAFKNNTTLTTVVFNDGLLTIGNYAFQAANAIKTLNWGKSAITEFGTDAFNGNLGISYTTTIKLAGTAATSSINIMTGQYGRESSMAFSREVNTKDASSYISISSVTGLLTFRSDTPSGSYTITITINSRAYGIQSFTVNFNVENKTDSADSIVLASLLKRYKVKGSTNSMLKVLARTYKSYLALENTIRNQLGYSMTMFLQKLSGSDEVAFLALLSTDNLALVLSSTDASIIKNIAANFNTDILSHNQLNEFADKIAALTDSQIANLTTDQRNELFKAINSIQTVVKISTIDMKLTALQISIAATSQDYISLESIVPLLKQFAPTVDSKTTFAALNNTTYTTIGELDVALGAQVTTILNSSISPAEKYVFLSLLSTENFALVLSSTTNVDISSYINSSSTLSTIQKSEFAITISNLTTDQLSKLSTNQKTELQEVASVVATFTTDATTISKLDALIKSLK
jgi:hypothetical protein